MKRVRKARLCKIQATSIFMVEALNRGKNKHLSLCIMIICVKQNDKKENKKQENKGKNNSNNSAEDLEIALQQEWREDRDGSEAEASTMHYKS